MNPNFNTTAMGKIRNDFLTTMVSSIIDQHEQLDSQLLTVQVQAIFESTALTNDDVIFGGDTVSTTKHQGNQVFKLLIKKCIKALPQCTHTVDDVAEAIWQCHKPRKFFEWNEQSASYSRLSTSDALYIIKYALSEETHLAYMKMEQENLNLFAMALDGVNCPEGQSTVIDDGCLLPGCCRRRDTDETRDGSQIERYPIDRPRAWEDSHQRNLLVDDPYVLDSTQADDQFDAVERSSKRARPTLEDASCTALPPDSRNHKSDNVKEPTEASHITPYPMGLLPDLQLMFSSGDLDHLRTVLAEQTESQDDLFKSLHGHSKQVQELASHTGLPPDIRYHLSGIVSEATDASRIARYPMGLPTDQQVTFSPEDLDLLNHLLAEQTESQDDLVQCLPGHNAQVEENTSPSILLPDRRHRMSDNASESADARYIAPYLMGLPTDQQCRFSPEDHNLLKNILAEQTESQDDLVQSLSGHDEQVQDRISHTGFPTNRRHHTSEKATEPTVASHITRHAMDSTLDKQLRFSKIELDLIDITLATQPEFQDDRVQSVFVHIEQVQENTFHRGLPPDGQVASHVIDLSLLGGVGFECSRINSFDFRKDVVTEQAECRSIYTPTVAPLHRWDLFRERHSQTPNPSPESRGGPAPLNKYTIAPNENDKETQFLTMVIHYIISQPTP